MAVVGKCGDHQSEQKDRNEFHLGVGASTPYKLPSRSDHQFSINRNEQVMISSLTGCLHQLKNYARNAVINYYIILNHICVVLRAKRLVLMTKWEKY
jgi:hypothetical protein